MASPFDTPSRSQRSGARHAVSALEKALGLYPSEASLDELDRRASESGPEPWRRAMEGAADQAFKTEKALKSGLERAAAVGEARGEVGLEDRASAILDRREGVVDPGLRLGLQESTRYPTNTSRRPYKGIGAILSEKEGFIENLGIPAELVRQAVTPGHEFGSRAISAGETKRAIKDYGDREPGIGGSIARGFNDATGLAGDVIATGSSAVVAPAMIAKEMWDNKGLPPPGFKDRIGEFWKDQRDTGQTTATDMALDPLSYISFGASGFKEAAKAAAIAGKAAGLDAKASAALGARIGELAKQGPEPAVVEAVKAELAKAIPDQTKLAKAAADVLGKQGELLERGGLRVGVPFAENIGFDVRIPGTQRLTAKGIVATREGVDVVRQAGAALRQKGGAKAVAGMLAEKPAKLAAAIMDRVFPWTDPAIDIGRAAQRFGRFFREGMDNKSQERLAQVWENAPADPARARQLFREVVDPDFVVLRAGGAAAKKHAQNPDLVVKEFKVGDKLVAVVGRKPPQMTPAEAKWVDDLQGFFDDYRKQLVKTGVLAEEQVGRNWLTGRYAPRIPRKAELEGPVNTFAKSKEGWDASRSRTAKGGVPIGRGDQWIDDPAKALASYSKAMSHKAGRNMAMKELERVYGANVSPRAKELVEVAFNQDAMTAAGMLRKLDMPNAAKAAGVSDWLMGHFKKNVLIRTPGYHVLNAANDTEQFITAGADDFVTRLPQAKDLLEGKRTSVRIGDADIPSDMLLEEARHAGINVGPRTQQYADLTSPHGTSLTGKLDQSARKGAKARGEKLTTGQKAKGAAETAGKALDTAALGPAGLYVASEWDRVSKLAAYMSFRSKGMSPRAASRLTWDTGIDYGDLSNPWLAAARSVMPFANWMAKAPLMAAQTAGRYPNRLSAVGAFERGILERPAEDDPYQMPTWLEKPSGGGILGPKLEGFARQVMPDLPENAKIAASRRAPHEESFRTITGFADPQHAIRQLHPIGMGLAELLTQRDSMNFRPLDESLNPQIRNEYGSLAAQAARVGPSFVPALGSPLAVHALNRLLYDETDPADQLNYFGMSRPTPPVGEGPTRAREAFGMGTRMRAAFVGPDQAFRNFQASPDAAEAELLLKELRQRENLFDDPAW